MNGHDALAELGAIVAAADAASISATSRQVLDQAIRASLLCACFGVEHEGWNWPYCSGGVQTNRAAALLGESFEALGGVARLATLAAASDLDPMDPGPAHTALPATLSACAAHACADAPAAEESDELVASAVLAGLEAARAIRRSAVGGRPGVGFHSAGTMGAVAAAAAAARVLRLDRTACANALAISLTRASGLAINSAASRIGLTHFGWGAAHGMEAALLASLGWSASWRLEPALAALYPDAEIDPGASFGSADGPDAVDALVFKRYPCNIYLNAVVDILATVRSDAIDRVDIEMPSIAHLDRPAPRDLREARNSVQAVAAIAATRPPDYAAFAGGPGAWRPDDDVARLVSAVHVVMDRSAPTTLGEAEVRVRVSSGSRTLCDERRRVADLRPWGAAHAQALAGVGGERAVESLYGRPCVETFSGLHIRRCN